MTALNILKNSPQLTLQSNAATHGSASAQQSESGSSFSSLLESLGSSSLHAMDGGSVLSGMQNAQQAAYTKPASEPVKKTETKEKDTSAEKKVSEDEKKKQSSSKAEETPAAVQAAAAQKKEASAKNAVKTEKESVKVVAKKASDSELQENQIAFLKNADKSQDADSILANVQEYSKKKSKSDLLKDAQDLSLENPKKFLDLTAVVGENQSASTVNASSLKKAVAQNESASSKTKDGTVKKEAKFSDRFTVVDERGQAAKENKSIKDKNAIKVSQDGKTADLTLTLSKSAEQNILSTNNQTAGASGSNFQAMLTEQVQQNVPEFVKAGSVILRDNSSGTINMVLKPESLGNVKISLELSDKVVTGQIVVSSQEAYDAMKENIDSLKQAFQQSGFDSANFNLSFANNGGNGSLGQGQQQNASTEWLSNRTYGDFASSQGASNAGEDAKPQYKSTSIYTIDFVA